MAGRTDAPGVKMHSVSTHFARYFHLLLQEVKAVSELAQCIQKRGANRLEPMMANVDKFSRTYACRACGLVWKCFGDIGDRT